MTIFKYPHVNFSKIIKFVLFVLIIFTLNSPNYAEGMAVMSVDLGAEFMKIAIVKPGVPMEIVLNKESRRKTPLAVSIRSNEREFGETALSQAIKSPKSAYLYITQLLGKSLNSPSVKSYRERYPYYDIRENATSKTVYFQHDESTTFTPEELLGMLLDYARDLAADFGEQSIDAAVIAIPAYFNQAERKAVLRAAEIVNLKVLQLINTNTAAGLNYGVFRRKDFNSTGVTLMFVDMGGVGTVATVATFQLVKSKDDIEANPQLTVRGVGFDRDLGGNSFTMRLANHLAKIFLEKTKKDVYKNPKALLKLYKEAERVKNVLSANADHFAQIEGLMDDVDFKAKVTRDEFEQICSDLFERVKNPINDAIKYAEIINDELNAVILVGGTTRIPKVQDELLKASNKKELGKNLNTDEAPALGAVYQAAYQSKGYKVKKFYIKDTNIYPIVVDFERQTEGGEPSANSNSIRRVLFDRTNNYPQKKVMTFNKHTSDFKFFVNYGDLSFYDDKFIENMGSVNISEVYVKGVQEIFQKHQNEESKGIKVHFKLDDSGILRLDKIDVSFEKNIQPEESTLSKIGNKISSFFGGKSEEASEENKNDQPTENKEEEKNNNENQNNEVNKNETSINLNTTTDTTPANNSQPKVNLTLLKEDIKFVYLDLDLIDIGKKSIESSRSKLQTIKEKEKEKKKRAASINSLEAFIFDTRDKLSQDEFIKSSNTEEREKLQAKLDEIDMWLSDADDSMETKLFSEKLTELKSASKDIFFRVKEKRTRPVKLAELKEVLEKSSDFLANAKNITGEDLPLSEVEWNTLDKLINSTKDWKTKMIAEQEQTPDNETPKLLTTDITDKIEALKREVNYLVSKIKYFRPKTKKPTTTDANDAKNANENTTEKKPTDSNEPNKDDSEKQDTQNEENSKKEFEDYFDKNEESSNEQSENSTPHEEKTTTSNPEL